jgi:hypothetical protein
MVEFKVSTNKGLESYLKTLTKKQLIEVAEQCLLQNAKRKIFEPRFPIPNFYQEGYSIQTAYKSKHKCAQISKKYTKERKPTNYKYKNFTMSIFNAGDRQQFGKLGIDKTKFPLLSSQKIPTGNLWKNKIVDKKYTFGIPEIKNTFEYLFKLLKKGIYVQIYNNELEVFLPFNNVDFENIWSERLKPPPHFKGTIYDFAVQNANPNSESIVNKNVKQWYSNNCIFRNTIYSKKAGKDLQFKSDEGDMSAPNFLYFLQSLCSERKVPNIEFFINYRDFPVLKKDFTDPYDALWNGTPPDLKKLNFKFPKIPIFSQSITKDYDELVIPHDDDIERVFEMATLPFCRGIPDKAKNYSWDKKKDICIFRGGLTGCGQTLNNNMRLKASYLSIYSKLIDSKLTSFKRRIKKDPEQDFVSIATPKKIVEPPEQDPSFFGLKDKEWKRGVKFYELRGDRISQDDQNKYKYILHIDGKHVAMVA